jgi:CheY-like chemotaxis protein
MNGLVVEMRGHSLTIVAAKADFYSRELELEAYGIALGLAHFEHVELRIGTRKVEKLMARRILLLEDDQGVAAVYATALRAEGHDIVVCHSFEAARTELRLSVPDALLTDVRLGEYNGLQLAILFRSLSPEGPIVAVSGHDDPVIRQEVLNLHAEFFVKPVSLDALRGQFRSTTRTN